jgi:glycine cleavage system regulatory protein
MKVLLEVPAKISPQDLLEKLNRLGEELAIDISLRRVTA